MVDVIEELEDEEELDKEELNEEDLLDDDVVRGLEELEVLRELVELGEGPAGEE